MRPWREAGGKNSCRNFPVCQCPFPGMDPFIESDNWQHFHVSLTVEIARQLGPQLPSYYRLSAELVVQEDERDSDIDNPKIYRPDIGGKPDRTGCGDPTGIPAARPSSPPPRTRVWPPCTDSANYASVMAAIADWSPPSRCYPSPISGVGGLVTHMKKLRSYWASAVHTVDIDLLRGGLPPYTIDEVPLTGGRPTCDRLSHRAGPAG